MTTLSSSAAEPRNVSNAPLDLHGWQSLAPLPDPVGYGGMFAGVLNGRLVAGGGSQFRDKPNWLQGEKVFSDRIFTLANPTAKWAEHATKLPVKMGHFASAATGDAIYLIGGLGASGCLAQAWQIRAQGDGFQITPLPDFPHPVGYAAAGIANGRLYVTSGLPDPASKSPSLETWSLDLAKGGAGEKWQRESDKPGPGTFVNSAASDGKNFYVIGGIGFDAAGKSTPSKSVYRFNTARAAWETLADLPEPRVGPVSPAPVIGGEMIFLMGGYAEVFQGPARDYPGFCAQTYYYHIARDAWENGPVLPKAAVPDRDAPGDPGPAPMIAAPGVIWQNRAVAISGEVRASVRSPQVIAWPLDSKKP